MSDYLNKHKMWKLNIEKTEKTYSNKQMMLKII